MLYGDTIVSSLKAVRRLCRQLAQPAFLLAPVPDVSGSKCSGAGLGFRTQPPTTRHPWRGLRLSPASVPANCCLLGRTLRAANILHKSQGGRQAAPAANLSFRCTFWWWWVRNDSVWNISHFSEKCFHCSFS